MIFTGGKQQAFLKDLRRVTGKPARRLGSRLGHMGHVGHEAEELALMKDRLQHHVLRHVTGTAIGIVVENNVARLEGLDAELVECPGDGEFDGADLRGAELRLRQHLARGVEDDAGEIERLVEDRRIARLHHRHAHVATGRGQEVIDHGQRDRIEFRALTTSGNSSVDEELTVRQHLHAHARFDQRRRAELLQDGRPGQTCPRRQSIAPVNRCRQLA